MDKKGIYRRFIIENISYLLSDKYNKETMKNLKRKYFVDRYKRKFGVPTNKEVAENLIFHLLKIRKINNIDELNSFIKKNKFLKKNIFKIDKFEQSFEETRSSITKDDIKKLKIQGTYEYEKQKIKDEIITESTQEIQNAIEQKKEEYLSLPSIIEKEEFNEPEVKEIERDEERIEWWERLNLFSNPFVRQEGLSQIPLELYDKVVLKTPIYDNYIYRAKNNISELLYSGKLLIGDFGSGKSTLFDYLALVLIEYKIKVFRITLQPRGDVFTYNIMFENKLFDVVKEFFKERFNYDFSGDPNIKSIIEMLNILVTNEDWSFLIAIDDLHKIIGGEQTVMKFLASLQITKDELIRNNIKIGFIVAGLPNWQNYLRADGAVKGFFDTTPDFMPAVEPEMAYEVIKMRFKAFSKNPDTNNFIDLNFIKQIHRKTVNEGSFLGFRTFMSNIEIELRDKGNYSIFESNPMEIDEPVKNEIREIIEANDILKRAFNKYIFGQKIKSGENRDFGLKVLIKIFLEKGMFDEDEFLSSNIYYFKILSKSNLINKINTNKGLKWIVNPELIKINTDLLNKYNLSMEDYLRPIFSLPYLKKKTKEKKLDKDHFDIFIEENKTKLDDEIEIILASIASYRHAVSLNILKIDDNQILHLINDWKTSLAQISSCIFYLENLLPVSSTHPKDILHKWKEYWTYPDALKRFTDELLIFNNRKDQLPLLRRCYLEAFNELFNLFENDLKINQQLYLSLENLNEDEINLFYKSRFYYISPYKRFNFFQLIKELTEYLEIKIRNFLLNFMSILFGERKNRIYQIKDLAIRGYIEKDPRIYENLSFNEFENLNRGQYRNIFLNAHNLRRSIFMYVFGDTYASEYKDFFKVFGDFNIITSHLKTQYIKPQHQSQINYYIINSADFIKKINIAYYNLIDKYFYIENETNENITILFSLRGLKEKESHEKIYKLEGRLLSDISDICSIAIETNEIDRVLKILDNISQKDKYYLDLEEYTLIERLFTIEYRAFIAIIAYLKYLEKIKIEKYYGSKILIMKS